MFENNGDYDFDDEILANSFESASKEHPNKRSIDSAPNEANKKPKPSNKTVEDSFKRPFASASICAPKQLSKNVVKRKFPGPAGILPDRKDFDLSVLEDADKNLINDEMPCSQTSLSVFRDGPWSRMSKDFEKLLDKYNIKWIKTRAGLNKLVNQKAPFLAATIQNIECFEGKVPIVNVTLRDMTGQIQGTIIHNLYEEYSDNLTTGSVIVLKQFGVLTTGYNNNHYLTITANNLATIYTTNGDPDVEKNEVKKISIQPVSCEAIINNFNNIGSIEKRQIAVGNSTQNRSRNVLNSVSNRLNFVPNKLPEKNSNKNAFNLSSDSLDLSLTLEEDLQIPDNFEETVHREVDGEKKKKFQFKSRSVVENAVNKPSSSGVTVSCSQVSVRTNSEHSEIWQDVFEGVDTDSLFEDF